MDQDNNQSNQAFKKDDAFQALTIINTWIGNIDTKISFALALAGILIGMIFSNGIPSAFKRVSEVAKLAELNGCEILAAASVGLLYISSFISILFFMFAIIARVNNPNNAESLFFFGSISRMDLDNYRGKLNGLTENELVNDIEEQIHTNSKICNQKTVWYNRGIKVLLVTIVLWFVCMSFGLI